MSSDFVEMAHETRCQHPSQCQSGLPAIHHWQGKDLCAFHSPFDSDTPTRSATPFPIKVGRRTVKWSRVSTVQYLGYFRRKDTGEINSISVFEYTPGFLTIVGEPHIEYHSLTEATAVVLAKY